MKTELFIKFLELTNKSGGILCKSKKDAKMLFDKIKKQKP